MVTHEAKVKEVIEGLINKGEDSFVITFVGYKLWSDEHNHNHYVVDYPFTNCGPEMVKDMLVKLVKEIDKYE